MSSFDLYQTVTDQIVAMLESGVVPWRSPILSRSKAGHPARPKGPQTGFGGPSRRGIIPAGKPID
jgi:antirestriction protein ArdC